MTTYFLDVVHTNVVSRGQLRREIHNLLQRHSQVIA